MFKESKKVKWLHLVIRYRLVIKGKNAIIFSGVCCDSTHGTTAYDFNLSTILGVEEYGEDIPVGWCLSNHEDFSFIKIFFEVNHFFNIAFNDVVAGVKITVTDIIFS